MKLANRKWSVVVAVAVCGLVTAATGWAALPAPVTLNGVGGVKPGMRIAAVEKRWGVDLRLSGEITPGCETAPVKAGAMRGYALFERGRFSAVFLTAGARTGRGLRIGSSVRRLKALHGPQLTSRPDFYVPGSRNLLPAPTRPPALVDPVRRLPGRPDHRDLLRESRRALHRRVCVTDVAALLRAYDSQLRGRPADRLPAGVTVERDGPLVRFLGFP